MRHYRIPFSRHGVPPGLISSLLGKSPITLIDVGASSGEFAASTQKMCGLRKALLVEPQPTRCLQLRERFSQPEVVIRQCALSDRDTTVEMEILNWDFCSSLLPVRRDLSTVSGALDLGMREKISCSVQTIDGLLTELGWNDELIDLLKIDVQGAELFVLRGAIQSLRNVGTVFCEVSFQPLYEGSAVFSEIYDFMYGQGFQLVSMTEGFRGTDGELFQADTVFKRRNLVSPF